MRWGGALMVVLSGALAGWMTAEAARGITRSAEKAEQILRALRALVCGRRLSLPEAIDALHAEYPRVFPEAVVLQGALRTESFAAVWKNGLRELSLPGALESILLPLGPELSAGEDPESCFERALSALQDYREQCLAGEREARRLYPALGLCGGLLMSIVLL